MGHIAHLRKQFKSINTYDYIITLIKRRKKNMINFMIIYCFFIWILTQGCFVPKLVEIGSVVLEKRFFWFRQCIFAIFGNYLPLEMGGVHHFNKLESPSPKVMMHCDKFGWNWLSGYGEEDVSISWMYFHYFVITTPWKREGSFTWINLNPLHPRMLCAKFGWNWLSGSGEEDF